MKFKLLLFLILIISESETIWAQRMDFEFNDVSLAQALSTLDKAYPKVHIHFIYDELELYKVTARINEKKPLTAVRKVVGYYPIQINTYKNHIFVEPVNHASTYLKGRLINEWNEPVSYATISLHSPTDSTFIHSSVSNENGDFTIPLQSSRVLMRVNSMGYQPFEKDIPVTDLQEITMQTASYNLDELIVNSERPIYSSRGNILRMKVENTPLAQIGRVTQILTYFPGLQNRQGAITDASDKPVTIYINGIQIRNYSELETISTDDIDNIQFCQANGSTQNSAHSTELYITLKDAERGHSGQYTGNVSEGKFPGTKHLIRWGYNQDKLKLSALINYSYQNNNQNIQLDMEHQGIKDYYSYALQSDIQTLQAQLCSEIQLSKKQKIRLQYEQTIIPSDIEQSPKVLSMESMNALNSIGLNPSSFWRIHYSPRHNLTANYTFQWGCWKTQLYGNYYKDQMSITNSNAIFGSNGISNRLWAFKMDTQLLEEHTSWLYGVEFTDTQHRTDFDNTTYAGITNRKERLFAAYGQFEWNTPSIQLKTGVRYEFVQSKFYYQNERRNNLSKLYPYISISRQKNENGMSLSYSVHSQRPKYNQMNSYSLYGSNLLSMSGNPNLRPGISHDIDFQENYKFFHAGTGFHYITHYIGSYLNVTNELYTIHFRNLPHAMQLSAFASVSPQWGKWNPQLTINYFSQFLTMNWAEGGERKFNRPLWTVNFLQTLTLSRNWILWLGCQYQSSGNVDTSLKKQNLNVQAGLSKQIGKWQLRLNADDILGTERRIVTYYGASDFYHSEIHSDTQRIEFSVTYKFGKSILSTPKDEAGKAERQRF